MKKYNQCRNTHVSTIATVVRKTTNTERFRLKLLYPTGQVCTTSSTPFQKTNQWLNHRGENVV
jgi:hypothetical protein